MTRKRKPKPPTLEEQLAELDAHEVAGDSVYLVGFGGEHFLNVPPKERVEWVKRRNALVQDIRKRDAKKLEDTGPIAGKYGVSPYQARHHVVRAAPKQLRSKGESQFPKRITTQRVIDRYRVRGHITQEEWHAADTLWDLWCGAQLEAKVTSGYEPVTTAGTASQDHKIAKRMDSADWFVKVMAAVPYRSQGVVRAVVIEDWTASDWARLRGYRGRDSERHGLARLRPGLSALAAFLGY